MKRIILSLLVFLIAGEANAASCSAYPYTLQNNTTADATQVMADFNLVRNCVINNAAGNGVNTDITSLTGLSTPLSVPQGGTPVFIGGTSTGSVNAQVVASTNPIGYALTSGYRITFTASATNNGATTLNVNSTGATAVRKLGQAGLEALSGGEIVSGNIVEAIYNGTYFVLLTTPPLDFGTATNLVGAATTDLGTIPSHNVNITGSGATITAFGSTAVVTEPIYLIKFAGINTLTYNASSLIIPGVANITTAANDSATVEYLGSGNWQVISYTKASGSSIIANTPLCGTSGLSIFNNSGTPNTNVDVTASNAVMNNSAGVPVSASSVSFTINTTTGGAGTSVANGMDGTARGNSTFYYLYVISNGNTTAGLASASATAPTLPSGYTYSCRIGAMATDGSGNFYRTLQKGRDTQYQVVSATNTANFPAITNGTAGNGTNCATAAATYALKTVRGNTSGTGVFAPATATKGKFIVWNTYNSAGPSTTLLSPNAAAGTMAGATTVPPLCGVGGATAGTALTCEIVFEANTVAFCADGAGSALNYAGWTDAINAN